MTRRTVYVAAPLSAPTARERAHNVLRASALVSMLHREGRAPICVHRLVDAGDYGDDADPEARATGLETAVALAAGCDDLFVLLRDDGTMSDGVLAEVRARPTPPGVVEYGAPCWRDLRARMEAVGLGDVWARLRIGPDVAGPWLYHDGVRVRLYGCRSRPAATADYDPLKRGDDSWTWGAWAPDGTTEDGSAPPESAAMAAADAWLRAHGVEVDDG